MSTLTSTKYKILHTADWHLRDSQYANPDRGDDFTKAAYAVIDTAMGHGVHAICNCGDILNNKRPSSRNIRDLVEIDRRLQAAGIPMYVISGNHDMSRPSWISILDEETRQKGINKTTGIIDADNKLHTITGTNLTVYGAPSMGAKGIRETRDTWPAADILLSHELVKEFAAFQTDDDTLSLLEYPDDRYKAILLGDIHTNSYKTVGTTIIGYPGSIELCSGNEATDKTVTLLEFVDGVCQIQGTAAIPSRKALFYRIMTDAHAEQALNDLKTYAAQDPIVLVRYDRRMHAVPAMFMTVLAGTKAILRCAAFADVNAGQLMGLVRDDGKLDHIKQPKDFVTEFIPAGTELYELAMALADPEADHRQMISDYVNERMGKNESDTFEDTGLRSAQIAG
jgi:DNA repair exonuclease SbcCD nuclease subunit